jgi:thioester reductase-like protein
VSHKEGTENEMSARRAIFLTGATGLLGRYFLRDLLASGQPVAVLIRDSAAATAPERLAELLAFCRESLGRELPPPVLLNGDLRAPHLGLGPAERRWLARRAQAVIHAAAYVAYHPTPDGEPWETNVHGTRRLLELSRSIGLTAMHHLSTAFVCGDRRGVVYEDELDCGGGSDNAYEKSKFTGEQLVRQFAGIRATIYRPSVVVGDSCTGYTSTYHHFYRFLELAVRLSSRTVSDGKPRRQRLPLRLPLTGEETQNLVPVDWVSQALLALMRRPQWHGKTFHLVARQPVRLGEIKAIIEDLLQLKGIRWAGRAELTDPTPLEQLVLEQFEDYWSYLHSNLAFDCRNTRRALPDLPPPPFGRELVMRLLRFAQADHWGRERGGSQSVRTSDFAHYLEFVLPEQVRRSPLAHALPADLLFVLDIQGPTGGQWSCRCEDGVLSVHRGAECAADVTYRMDAGTFDHLIRGRQSAQKAFFDGRIEIDGDMEKALKLAMLIEQFLAENPNRPAQPTETLHATAGI